MPIGQPAHLQYGQLIGWTPGCNGCGPQASLTAVRVDWVVFKQDLRRFVRHQSHHAVNRYLLRLVIADEVTDERGQVSGKDEIVGEKSEIAHGEGCMRHGLSGQQQDDADAEIYRAALESLDYRL